MSVCESSRAERKREHFSVICVFIVCSFAAGPLLFGTVWLSPHDVGLWLWAEGKLGKWDKSRGINLCLSPPTTLPPPSRPTFHFSAQSYVCPLIFLVKSKTATPKNSTWCPWPIAPDLFLSKTASWVVSIPRVTQSWRQIFKQEIFLIIRGQKKKRKANAEYLFFEPETTVKMWRILVC